MKEYNEQPKAIEILSPVHKYWYETPGGEITVYRLRLMTREQIAAHGLEKYVKGDNDDEESK
ncbi:hypothetical protein [Planococcus sp. S3-L1]|uniref:hypothetical protein n=1 Tax=Planococcus sp. S3-L1 TaxID=3046200 RepID=UPI0024B87C89|nr:hypothetical protein [Planococcus sp. S3-L1]MDJ0332117.1 hypothetical protein [Planococcus sp. S3-L1]